MECNHIQVQSPPRYVVHLQTHVSDDSGEGLAVARTRKRLAAKCGHFNRSNLESQPDWHRTQNGKRQPLNEKDQCWKFWIQMPQAC